MGTFLSGAFYRKTDAAKPLLTPLIHFVVMVPATIMVIGPASAITANAIANGYNALVARTGIGRSDIGGLWQVVVIFGVHTGNLHRSYLPTSI